MLVKIPLSCPWGIRACMANSQDSSLALLPLLFVKIANPSKSNALHEQGIATVLVVQLASSPLSTSGTKRLLSAGARVHHSL